MTTLLTIILVILAVLLIGLILMQPDRSQGMVNNSNIFDNTKEPIEQLTEYIAIAFLVVAILFQIIR